MQKVEKTKKQRLHRKNYVWIQTVLLEKINPQTDLHVFV